MMKMNKLFIGLFVGLLLVSSVSATNWYVDNAVTTSGNGQSWGTAWKNFSNIVWSFIKAGDTLYISGGPSGSSKTYYETLYVGGANIYDPGNVKGTAGHPIVITKGVDAGHNGTVVIDGGGTREVGINLYYDDYITISNLTISNPAAWTLKQGGLAGMSIYSHYTNNIEISNCVIGHDYNVGIFLDHSDSTKILNNNFPMNSVNTLATTISIVLKWSSDNVEIAYNTMMQRNEHDGTPTNVHKDIIQVEGTAPYNNNGSIHHNFGMHDLTTSPSYVIGFQLAGLIGTWEVYNNVVIANGNDPSIATRMVGGDPSYNFIIKFYNNIMIAGGTKWNDYVLQFANADSIYCYNNILSRPEDGYGIRVDGSTLANMHFDYNRWHSVSSVNSYFMYDGANFRTFAYWQGTLGQDHSSSLGAVSFANLWGINAADYKTTSAWTGIDLGTPIAGITDDFVGTSRPQGTAWDIGAYEYASGCNPADTNCDNCISLGEISSYVSKWLQGQITLNNVSGAVNLWMKGC